MSAPDLESILEAWPAEGLGPEAAARRFGEASPYTPPNSHLVFQRYSLAPVLAAAAAGWLELLAQRDKMELLSAGYRAPRREQWRRDPTAPLEQIPTHLHARICWTEPGLIIDGIRFRYPVFRRPRPVQASAPHNPFVPDRCPLPGDWGDDPSPVTAEAAVREALAAAPLAAGEAASKPPAKNRGGRPTSKPLVRTEAERQVREEPAGIPDLLKDWGNKLSAWLGEKHPKEPQAKGETCAEYVSDIHRAAKSGKLINR